MSRKSEITDGILYHINIAWGAGIFEGEGSFCFSYNKPKAIQITSTDLDVLEKIVTIFGGKIYKATRNNLKPHWKDAYTWRLSLSKCLEFLEKVEPFLCKRRMERANEFKTAIINKEDLKVKKSKESLERYVKILELKNEGYTHKKIAEIFKVERSTITKILNGDCSSMEE